jgi:hypothetical protein
MAQVVHESSQTSWIHTVLQDRYWRRQMKTSQNAPMILPGDPSLALLPTTHYTVEWKTKSGHRAISVVRYDSYDLARTALPTDDSVASATIWQHTATQVI